MNLASPFRFRGAFIMGALLCSAVLRAEAPIDFNRQIRPILAESCFKCHGPDADKREGELQIDDEKSATIDRDGHRVVVSGDPAKSELYQRLITDDPDERMPPPDSKKSISKDQIELLRKWIEQGGTFAKPWAQVPPTRPALPKVSDAKWPRNDVDRFVAAKLDQAKLRPSPEADRRTLIRRLSFDLVGLPPTLEQVQAFVADRSPDAHEKLVDRLLSDRHYGERMAVYWLDLVRYADSIGYHSDNVRDVWMYRDWVIRAFNDNMPYDRFTVEQIAGDLLPEATSQQKIASGYNRLLQTTQEGGSQAKEYLAKYSADRVRNLGEVWLAATTGCAECHNHKFDPYTTKDFYSLAAFFADVKERAVGKQAEVAVPSLEYEAQLKALDAEIAATQEQLASTSPAAKAALAKWEVSALESLKTQPSFGPWHSAGPFQAAGFDQVHDGAFPPETSVDLKATYLKGKVKWKPQPGWKDGTVISLSGDNSATYLFRTVSVGADLPLNLSLGSDDGIKVWINGQEVLNRKVSRAVAPDQEKITVQLKQGENELLMKITNGSGGYGFYFKAGQSGLPAEIVRVLRIPREKRNAKQQAALAKYHGGTTPEKKAVRDKIAQLTKRKQDLSKKSPKTLITQAVAPRTMRILPRGNWLDESGPVVTPAVPEFFGKLDVGDRRANRLDLAELLVRKDNPIVARAVVNR
ncbi:MAG: PSD1 and planctomycete cytochrome C domain-containing protein [Planctomycetales bacterium]